MDILGLLVRITQRQQDGFPERGDSGMEPDFGSEQVGGGSCCHPRWETRRKKQILGGKIGSLGPDRHPGVIPGKAGDKDVGKRQQVGITWGSKGTGQEEQQSARPGLALQGEPGSRSVILFITCWSP